MSCAHLLNSDRSSSLARFHLNDPFRVILHSLYKQSWLPRLVTVYGPARNGLAAEQLKPRLRARLLYGLTNGVRKVTVDPDTRLAMTGAIRTVYTAHPAQFDPRKYLGPAREAMAALGLRTRFGDHLLDRYG